MAKENKLTEIIERLSDVIPSDKMREEDKKHEKKKKTEDLHVKDMRDNQHNEDQKSEDKKDAPTWNDMSPDTEFNDPNKEGK